MTRVNWTGILSNRGTVDFSSLEIPEHRDEFEPDVAQFRLADGSFIDVTWVFDAQRYFVTRFRDSYENPIREIECRTPSEVIEAVRRLLDEPGVYILYSASAPTSENCEYEFQDA